jgi:hypothetical protein
MPCSFTVSLRDYGFGDGQLLQDLSHTWGGSSLALRFIQAPSLAVVFLLTMVWALSLARQQKSVMIVQFIMV